jgi:hypothetical protein
VRRRISDRTKDRLAWGFFALAVLFVLAMLGFGALLLHLGTD